MALLQHHHLLLVTLLLANASVMEALPIVLDKLVPSFVAIIISVTAVLSFGEIIPQAISTRAPLAVGGTMAPVVWFFMGMLFLVSWPISKVLDCVLGHDDKAKPLLFNRDQLSVLVHLQKSENTDVKDEADIMQGALQLRNVTVAGIMTSFERMFSLSTDTILNQSTVLEVMRHGHSRVPVWRGSPHNVVGMVLVKRLLATDFRAGVPVSQLEIRDLIAVPPRMPLFQLLREFQTGRSHMAVVTEQYRTLMECWATRTDAVTDTDSKRDVHGMGNGTPVAAASAVAPSPKSTTSSDGILAVRSSTASALTAGPATVVRIVGVITLSDVIAALLQENVHDGIDKTMARSPDHRVRISNSGIQTEYFSPNSKMKVDISPPSSSALLESSFSSSSPIFRPTAASVPVKNVSAAIPVDRQSVAVTHTAASAIPLSTSTSSAINLAGSPPVTAASEIQLVPPTTRGPTATV